MKKEVKSLLEIYKTLPLRFKNSNVLTALGSTSVSGSFWEWHRGQKAQNANFQKKKYRSIYPKREKI